MVEADKFILAVRTKAGWERFIVPEEVYLYVKQLEEYINHPSESKLKELYPERFSP